MLACIDNRNHIAHCSAAQNTYTVPLLTLSSAAMWYTHKQEAYHTSKRILSMRTVASAVRVYMMPNSKETLITNVNITVALQPQINSRFVISLSHLMANIQAKLQVI
jgi:hypothetical protein